MGRVEGVGVPPKVVFNVTTERLVVKVARYKDEPIERAREKGTH